MDWFIPEWLLALALTLFITDIFVSTEILSWGGVLSLSVWLTWKIDANWKWSVLVFIASFIFFASVYYFFFRNVIGRFVRGLFQRGSPNEVTERMKGATGRIHYVEGKCMMRWNGDELWQISNPSPGLLEGQEVAISEFKDGRVVLLG